MFSGPSSHVIRPLHVVNRGGNSTGIDRVSCDASIHMWVPAGWRLAFQYLTMMGDVDVQNGADDRATLSATAYVDAGLRGKWSRSWIEPVTEVFRFDEVAPESMKFSDCNDDRKLAVVSLYLKLVVKGGAKLAVATDSGMQLGLVWEQCR